MVTRSRLHAVTDLTSADWLQASVGPFGSGVGSLLPRGYQAYARVFHPAADRDHRFVSWAQIAAWSGRTMHPLAQFEHIARPAAGHGKPPRPWAIDPEPGNLPPAVLTELCAVLATGTVIDGHCWFCLWDGWGDLYPPGEHAVVTATFTGAGGSEPAAADEQASQVEPDLAGPELTASVLAGRRVRLPHRDYLLLEGPLDAAAELGWSFLAPRSPNLFWPDDRSWCVATEIDLDSTYLGGSAELIQNVLLDDRLEALPVLQADQVTYDSDLINN